jgi:hypothetical protein
MVDWYLITDELDSKSQLKDYEIIYHKKPMAKKKEVYFNEIFALFFFVT